MKTILVTGATGFLGRPLVRQLREGREEVNVRILCRGPSPWDSRKQIEIFHGDISSPQDVELAVAGVDEVYHLAGVVSRSPNSKWLLYRTHVEGTRNLCEAARKHAVRKIVVVSSSGTIAVSREPVIHKEGSGYKYEMVGHWPYYLSKIYAEKVALACFRQFQLPVVVVNPSLLLGPGDARGSSTGDVALFLEGEVMAVPLGGLNFVDVRDAARGVIAAMRSGRVGERYLLGGPNWSFREFLQQLSRISGVAAPKLRLPLGVSLATASVLREIMPWAGKSFPLDDVSIRMSALYWYCDSSKARAELAFETRDPVETLRETVADIRERKAAYGK